MIKIWNKGNICELNFFKATTKYIHVVMKMATQIFHMGLHNKSYSTVVSQVVYPTQELVANETLLSVWCILSMQTKTKE